MGVTVQANRAFVSRLAKFTEAGNRPTVELDSQTLAQTD